MARRSRSTLHPAWIAGVIVLLVLGFLGARSLIGTNSEPYRTAQALDVSSYLENANSLRGNVYKLEGEVMNSLSVSPTQGRLFSFGVNNNADLVPILIPSNLNHINVQKGQRFVILLEVADDGILRAKELTKS